MKMNPKSITAEFKRLGMRAWMTPGDRINGVQEEPTPAVWYVRWNGIDLGSWVPRRHSIRAGRFFGKAKNAREAIARFVEARNAITKGSHERV